MLERIQGGEPGLEDSCQLEAVEDPRPRLGEADLCSISFQLRSLRSSLLSSRRSPDRRRQLGSHACSRSRSVVGLQRKNTVDAPAGGDMGLMTS